MKMFKLFGLLALLFFAVESWAQGLELPQEETLLASVEEIANEEVAIVDYVPHGHFRVSSDNGNYIYFLPCGNWNCDDVQGWITMQNALHGAGMNLEA